MVWRPIISVCWMVVLLTPAVVQGYDEAGCKVRSNETYFSGINAICNLPLGAGREGIDGSYPPFQMNRCTGQKDTGHNALNTVYGILAAFLACIMFGSMFLPVKKFDTGDGMFFQWMMATGALLVGLVFNLTAWPQPPFLSFAMTGGMLWGVGNILTVPTLKLLGMGMTQTMVGVANTVGGIITGRFILCQPLRIPLLNTFGVIVVLVSAVLLSFVRSDGRKKKDGKPAPIIPVSEVSDYSVNDEKQPLISNNTEDSNADQSWVDKLGKIPSRGIGLAMAITSGFLFGFQFLPVEFLRNCDHSAFPCEELDYVFPQYVGIYLLSTISFAVYCCFKRFNPQVYSKVIIPGIVTGIMYGIGTAMWFLSNKYVGLPVAFPIITSGSGMISSAWGILVFREIRGRFNIIMFLIAFAVVVAGIVMVGLSH